MNVKDFFELFFVIAAAIAMPFIVIGTYFNFFPNPEERRKIGAIIFLIISIIYALAYTYFSWKSLKANASWKRIVDKKEEKGKK
jgi:Na+/phosphate symporter